VTTPGPRRRKRGVRRCHVDSERPIALTSRSDEWLTTTSLVRPRCTGNGHVVVHDWPQLPKYTENVCLHEFRPILTTISRILRQFDSIAHGQLIHACRQSLMRAQHNSLPRCGSWNSSRNAQHSSYKSKPCVRQYEHSSKQETEITHTVIWHGLDWANSSIISSISYLPLWSKQIDSAMKQRKGHFYQLRITTLLWPLVPVWLFAVILYSKCYYGNAETTAKNLHSYECIHRITGYHRITMNFVCSNITQQTLECHGSHKHMTSYSSCLMQ